MMTTPHTRLLLIAFVGVVSVGSCSPGDSRQGSIGRGLATRREVHLTDAVGTRIRLDRPAARVVSLAPNLTESLSAIGADDLLVGRTAYCDFPLRVQSVRVVGDLQTINYEAIVSQHPDIVLMSIAGNSEASYQKLRELGLTPFAFQASTVDGVLGTLDTIGILTGRKDQARRVSDSLRRRVKTIQRRGEMWPRTSVFFVVNRTPLMTVSTGFLAETIELAGGDNIAAGARVTYPVYSREELVRRDPDVIIVPATNQADIETLLSSYPEWRTLRAVRNGRIHTVSPDPFMRPGPRLVDALESLFSLLHPSNGAGEQPTQQR